jgi:hypothetical protein
MNMPTLKIGQRDKIVMVMHGHFEKQNAHLCLRFAF